MTAAARRLWLYGLALFLPALAVGGLALGLLSREQARLAERERVAVDSRRAAVESRARLIAENIELLVGDVQSTLMATLADAPVAESKTFLLDWQANNPLVRDVFHAASDGRVLWRTNRGPLHAWLDGGAPWVEPRAPASDSRSAPAASDRFATAFSTEDRAKAEIKALAPAPAPAAQEARRDISSNVVQYQRARQEIQEVAKVRNSADVAAKVSADSLATNTLGSSLVYGGVPEPAPVLAAPFTAAPEADAGKEKSDGAAVSSVQASHFGFVASPGAAASARPAEPPPVLAEPLTRSGWTPWRDKAGLHLFGWRELPDRTVIGLELQLDAIKARLGEVFPAVPEPGEAYALRDSDGAAWHRVGNGGLPVALEVPLAAAALPGWTVVAHARAPGSDTASGAGFFALGASLVALLVLMILAAGALLVRQARLSELEAAQKTSFVANVSHELKTPLTTIRLYAELLAEGRVREEGKRADYLATIGQETQRLARLVANVLDFSRLEQGRKKYERARVDLAAELRRLAEAHAPRLAAAGLELRLAAPGSLPVCTDRDAVEQIVLNLLDNACKYAAEGGEVLLAAEASAGGGASVVVADRGPGVPDGQRERIFEKFHRVDDRLTAEKGGAGLGLSIARQLARGLGGDLRCAPRPGGGAEFVLTLPAG